MKFFVQQVDQEQIEINIPQETSLEQLRELLVSQHSYPDQPMYFIFNGNILKGADALSELKENSLITVYVKNKAKHSIRKSRKQANKPNPENPAKETTATSQEETIQQIRAEIEIESEQNRLQELIDGPITKPSDNQNELEQPNEETNQEISIEKDPNSHTEGMNEDNTEEDKEDKDITEDKDTSKDKDTTEDKYMDIFKRPAYNDYDYEFLFNEDKLLADMAECFKKIHVKQLYDSDLQFPCQLNETRRIADLIQHNPALQLVVENHIKQNYTMATALRTINIKSAEELAGFVPFRPFSFEDEDKILLWQLTHDDRDIVRQLMHHFDLPHRVIIQKYFESGRDPEITEVLLQTIDTNSS